MAIINLTPDSFYARSRNLSCDEVYVSLRQAIEGGATIVDLGGYSSRPGASDVSVGEMDEAMVGVVAKNNLMYVAMHMRGTPKSMSELTSYPEGVVKGVVDYFARRIEELVVAGIKRDNIILDPGFGFAKSVEQNWELMRGLGELYKFGLPVLVGVSRKSMLYKPLGLGAEDVLPSSLALAWESLRHGATILRVHDVRETHQIVELRKYYDDDSDR
jgi:dihydropteroate synthase